MILPDRMIIVLRNDEYYASTNIVKETLQSPRHDDVEKQVTSSEGGYTHVNCSHN